MPKLANKNYPYPIITKDASLSSYNGISYSFSFEKETNETQLILKNAKIETDSKNLINLLKENKVKAVVFVSCTKTYFRYTTEIGTAPRDIVLKLSDLNDKVTISAYVFANEELVEYKSDECNEYYKDYSFDIDKYCLFAIDDGYKLPVEYDDYSDKKVSSIFSVAEIEEDVDRLIKVYPEEKNIVIAIPKKECEDYYNMKDLEDYSALFLSLLGCPALTTCLNELQKEGKAIEEIVEQYSWFKTIVKTYKRINGVDLDDSLFEQMNCFEFSQQALGNCNVTAISTILTNYQKAVKSVNEDEEESE